MGAYTYCQGNVQCMTFRVKKDPTKQELATINDQCWNNGL